jgi:hypothetical protein
MRSDMTNHQVLESISGWNSELSEEAEREGRDQPAGKG